jgi:hypothetical protein
MQQKQQTQVYEYVSAHSNQSCWSVPGLTYMFHDYIVRRLYLGFVGGLLQHHFKLTRYQCCPQAIFSLINVSNIQ